MPKNKGNYDLRGEYAKKMDVRKGRMHVGEQNMSMSLSGSDRKKIVRMKEEQARRENLRGKWS